MNTTAWYEVALTEGTCERVYPCRCGGSHRGEYAVEDWNHHNCFHEAPLWAVDAARGDYICADCGNDFKLARP